MNKTQIFSLATIISLGASIAFAQAVKYPDYIGYINDFAKVLSPETISALDDIARQIENKTTAQIALVTVATVKPLTIEEYATALFERWGIGQRQKDNGVLILLTVNDRAIRIEIGYGLEGALPDAVCNRIIYEYMIPEFKKGNFDKGMLRGTIAVAQYIAKEYNVELNIDIKSLGLEDISLSRGDNSRIGNTLLYLFFLILLLWILRLGPFIFWTVPPIYKKRGRYWYGGGFGGGSFGGGFGGFGGGLSGGGGASGRW